MRVDRGFALRHVSDLKAAFREYLRVLKPGGRLWILEAHVARSRLGYALTRPAERGLPAWHLTSGSDRSSLIGPSGSGRKPS